MAEGTSWLGPLGAPNAPEERPEDDVNAAFDDVVMSEDHIVRQGYEEGLVLGRKQGEEEGYALGHRKGAEIGGELGYYEGMARVLLTWIETDNLKLKADNSKVKGAESGADNPNVTVNNSRVKATLEALLAMIEAFPRENIKEVDTVKMMRHIRAKFRTAFLQMKMLVPVYGEDTLSF